MKKLLIATVFAAMAGAKLAGAGELNTNGCHAAWTDATLTVGNALFTRSYVAKGDAAFAWAREATRTHESFCREGKKLRAAAEANDALSIYNRHLKTTSFECRDQTDHRDRLVVADERQLMSYAQ